MIFLANIIGEEMIAINLAHVGKRKLDDSIYVVLAGGVVKHRIRKVSSALICGLIKDLKVEAFEGSLEDF